MWLWLKFDLPITPDMDNLSSKLELCVVFHFQVKGGHERDAQTNGWTGCNA